MLPYEINTGGVRAAQRCIGDTVTLRMDRAYPASPSRTFSAVLVAVYPRGLLMARANRGAREFVSYVDVFAGHIHVSGTLGVRLRREWLRADPLDLVASW